MVERAPQRRQLFLRASVAPGISTYRVVTMGTGAAHSLDDAALVRALKALGDATRFRMTQEIASAGELSCGEVAELFDVSQPTISHHLKILIEAGVLVVRNAGKHHYTSVNRALLASLADLLPARLAPPSRRPAARPPAAAKARP
jgi:ArsR family transcriptional regulator